MIGFKVLSAAALFAGMAVLSACNSTGTAPTRVAIGGLDCPDMLIRSGGQAHVVYDRTGTTDPSRVRYRATVLQISRECYRNGDVVEIAFHVSGRVIGGPRASGNTGSATLQVDLEQGGAVTGRREYTVAASIAAPLYAGDYRVDDTLAVPMTTVRSTRIVVGLEN